MGMRGLWNWAGKARGNHPRKWVVRPAFAASSAS